MANVSVKIVEVAEFYSERGGGVRTYTHQKLAACARLGHETVIIAPGAENREQMLPGGKIVWVKAPRLPVDPRYHMFAAAEGVNRAISRENPDVLVGASPWKGGWIAGQWQAPPDMKRPLKVLFMHADPMAVYAYTLFGGVTSRTRIDQIFAWFWRYLSRLSALYDATLVGSPWLARRLSEHGMSRVRSVPFGVELSVFNPALRNEDVRAHMLRDCGLPPSASLVLSVGRHHPEKRLGTLIAAIKLIQKSRPVGLYMVGDGLIRRWVAHKAAKVPHIFLAGQIDDRKRLAAVMASADVLLHGSASETYGRVLAESLASGLPIVVPDQGGAADFAASPYGEIYRAGDAAAAASSLGRLLAKDRAEISRAAAAAATSRIGSDADHFVRLYACFMDLLTQRHPDALKVMASPSFDTNSAAA